MIKHKKASHVGIIISFIIFITFLAFIYAALNPILKNQEEKKKTLQYLETKIQLDLESNLTTTTVNLDSSPGGSCIILEGIGESIDLPNIRIHDADGNVLGYDVDGNNIDIGDATRLLKIYYSDEFDDASGDPSSCVSEGYEIVSSKIEKKIFESRAINFISRYQSQYNTLKSDLNVPTNSEFGFDFIYENGTKIGSGEINSSASIYAGEVPVGYLTSEANINFGKLIVKVW